MILQDFFIFSSNWYIEDRNRLLLYLYIYSKNESKNYQPICLNLNFYRV